MGSCCCCFRPKLDLISSNSHVIDIHHCIEEEQIHLKVSNETDKLAMAIQRSEVEGKNPNTATDRNTENIEASTSMDDQYYLDEIKDFIDDSGHHKINNMDQIISHFTSQSANYSDEVNDFKLRIQTLLKNEMQRQYVS